MLREHRRNVCKIRVEGEYLQTFLSRVLSTSRVGYCAGKPIESALYCSYKYVFNISIFQGLTGAVNHMFFTVLDPCSVLSIS